MRYCWISHFFLALLLSVASIGQDSSQRQAPNCSESSSKSHSRTAHPQATPDPGSLSNGVYQSRFFGFRFQAPFGWVDRTEAMQEGNEAGKSLVLLAIFERPPQAKGETVNSAVIIAAENVSAYPGLKTAADYFEPLTEVITSKGFQVINPPYEFALGAKSLVRGDFSKDLHTVKMFQSTLVSVQKGYVLSFTFIGSDEKEIEDLAAGLTFAGNRPPGR